MEVQRGGWLGGGTPTDWRGRKRTRSEHDDDDDGHGQCVPLTFGVFRPSWRCLVFFFGGWLSDTGAWPCFLSGHVSPETHTEDKRPKRATDEQGHCTSAAGVIVLLPRVATTGG